MSRLDDIEARLAPAFRDGDEIPTEHADLRDLLTIARVAETVLPYVEFVYKGEIDYRTSKACPSCGVYEGYKHKRSCPIAALRAAIKPDTQDP